MPHMLALGITSTIFRRPAFKAGHKQWLLKMTDSMRLQIILRAEEAVWVGGKWCQTVAGYIALFMHEGIGFPASGGSLKKLFVP